MAVVVALLTLVVLAPTASAAKKKPRPLYWGAVIGKQLTGEAAPFDMGAIDAFERKTRKGISLLSFSSPFFDCIVLPCVPYHFPTFIMESLRQRGTIPFLSWASQSVQASLDQPDYTLASVANGNHDAYIREFAEQAKAWNRPFFLRFDAEMNGFWFPWGESVNNNQPGDFVAAWRHVHDIFDQVGAYKATWVWCPNVDFTRSLTPLHSLYPGHEYVDWTCLDGFNWSKNGVNPQPWRSFDKIFDRSYRTITQRLAPNKPMILAEMASGGGPRAKAKWIDDMFEQLRTKYRRIRGLIWFEQIDRGVQWPIESSGAATKAFRRGIRQPGFRVNHYAGLSGSPIMPPR